MLISERIYHIMKEKGISQIEFAKKTGISQSTVSDWKRKGTNPSADKILVICEVLGVSPYELLMEVDSKNKKKHQESNYIYVDKTSKEYQMIEFFQKFDEDEKNRILNYIIMLKNKK